MRVPIQLAASGLLCLVTLAQSRPNVQPAMFAARAIFTSSGKAAVSPNGKASVRTKLTNEETFLSSVEVRSPQGVFKDSIAFGLNTEVLWSDDSAAFAITGSSEGANGRYETTVFLLHNDSMEKIALTSLAENAFGNPVMCGWPEVPNVSSVTWLRPSRVLLVATQIIDHSNCDSFGTFKAYAIDVQDKRIIRTYNQLESKRFFGSYLGRLLSESRDICIVRPEECWVSTNHR